MRSYRILSILATIVFALVLTTTDAYSDPMNIIVHTGGNVTDIVHPPGTDTSLPVGEYSGLFTVVPDSTNQVAKVLLFEGSSELVEIGNTQENSRGSP